MFELRIPIYNMRIKKTVLLFLFLLIGQFAIAQNQGYLELVGQVQQDGKGLEGAEIKVMNRNE